MPAERRLRIGVLTSHPIQYQAPIFRELAKLCELTVYFAHRQTPQAQAAAGFGVEFDWDVDLLAGYRHEFLNNVSSNPDTGRFLGCDTPQIADRVENAGFDAFLVMGWHLKCYWQAIRACRRQGVLVMVRGDSQLGTSRSLIKRAVKQCLYPLLLRQFDALLYVGQRNRDYLLHYGLAPDRLHFSPHCVDTSSFQQAAAASRTAVERRAWDLPRDTRALLFSGKLVARKRPADLIAAAEVLASRGRKVSVVFAGDGPLRASLASQAQALNVRATFLGFCNQSRLPGVYAAADLLVLPSDSTETWGLVVNEAMACGTPCVVSEDCGCAPDMISPGTGRSFRTGDVQALAAAIEAVMDDPQGLEAALLAKCAAYSTHAAAAGIIHGAMQAHAPLTSPQNVHET